jgi:hypothetical protein
MAHHGHYTRSKGDPQLSFSLPDRCRQKSKFRQQKSSGRYYHVGDDVWALHPNYNIMCIASVVAVNKYQRTCKVIFSNDQTLELPINHLHYATWLDVQRARRVDYEQGWSERTHIAAIDIYNQYGELQETPFTSTSEDIYDDFFTNEDSNNVILIRIPDPEEPTATFSHCPILNASSYADAEAKAMELMNQDDDYLKAVQRAKHRKDASQQPSFSLPDPEKPPSEVNTTSESSKNDVGISSQGIKSDIDTLDEHLSPSDNPNLTEVYFDRKQILDDYRVIKNSLQRHEIAIDKLIQLFDHLTTTNNSGSLTEHTTSPTPTPSTTDHAAKQVRSEQISQLFEVVDQELIFDHTQDEKHQSMFSVTDVQDLPTVKQVITQTESPNYLSTAAIAYSNQPTDDVSPLTICKERSITWSVKSHWQIQQDLSSITKYIIDKQLKFSSRLRFNNSSNYVLTKFLFSSLLVVMIICQILAGSMINEKDVNSVPLTNRHMVSTNIIYTNAIPILMATLIPFSSILNGPSRSMFELWFYPFAVP